LNDGETCAPQIPEVKKGGVRAGMGKLTRKSIEKKADNQ